MSDEFAAVGGRQPSIDLLQKPAIIIDEALNGLLHQRCRVAALICGQLGQLSFQVGFEMHFIPSV